MQKPPRVILGSSSRWRQQVLRDAGIPFEVISPDIDERSIRFPDPFMLTYAIAGAKATAVAALCGPAPAIIITADQVAVFRGKIREKPESEDEALLWLSQYDRDMDNMIDLVTTVIVSRIGERFDLQSRKHRVGVRFNAIPPDAAKAAVARGDVMHSCGAVVTDDPSLAPFLYSHATEIHPVWGTSDEKDTHSSIQGLPIGPTLEMLARVGVTAPKR